MFGGGRLMERVAVVKVLRARAMESERSAGGGSQSTACSTRTHLAELAGADARTPGLVSDSFPGISCRSCVTFWLHSLGSTVHADWLRDTSPTNSNSPTRHCQRLPSVLAPSKSPGLSTFCSSCNHVRQRGMCCSSSVQLHAVVERVMLTPPSGQRGCLCDAPVAGHDEEQAQGRPDRPRPAEAQE